MTLCGLYYLGMTRGVTVSDFATDDPAGPYYRGRLGGWEIAGIAVSTVAGVSGAVLLDVFSGFVMAIAVLLVVWMFTSSPFLNLAVLGMLGNVLVVLGVGAFFAEDWIFAADTPNSATGVGAMGVIACGTGIVAFTMGLFGRPRIAATGWTLMSIGVVIAGLGVNASEIRRPEVGLAIAAMGLASLGLLVLAASRIRRDRSATGMAS